MVEDRCFVESRKQAEIITTIIMCVCVCVFERLFLLSLHSSHGGDRVPLITKQRSPPNKGEGADSRACAVLITSAASPSELAGEPGLDVHSRTQVRREALTPKHETFIHRTGCYRRRSGREGGRVGEIAPLRRAEYRSIRTGEGDAATC